MGRGERAGRAAGAAAAAGTAGQGRTRRARGTLSTRQVVIAALEVLDRDGLEGLSMPRLAAALGCGTMSLYSHVTDKQALLELVLAEALDRLPDPAPSLPAGDLTWLRDWATAVYVALMDHRGVAAVLGRCAFPTDVVRRQLGAAVHTLQGQGLDAQAADRVLGAVLDLVLGAASRAHLDPTLGSTRDDQDERFTYALAALIGGLEQQALPRPPRTSAR